jgi:hypothetical protein
VRALRLEPKDPAGSVILLAGGHGNLALGKDGSIGWGADNQLVRTRRGYAKAGFVTLVPDIARDLKQGGSGVVPRYRWSEAYAKDIGALVIYLRGVAEPVYLVGTSRSALSVANAAARLEGPGHPDAIVITSGMLMHVDDRQPSVERTVGGLERITQPTFILFHARDGCAHTPASSVPRPGPSGAPDQGPEGRRKDHRGRVGGLRRSLRGANPSRLRGPGRPGRADRDRLAEGAVALALAFRHQKKYRCHPRACR